MVNEKENKSVKKHPDMLFSGLTPEEYRQIKPLVDQENRKNIIVYTVIIAAAMCLLLIYGILADTWVDNQRSYAYTLCLTLLLFALSRFAAPRIPYLNTVLMYAFVVMIIIFGGRLAVSAGPEIPTVSFIAILLALPTLFTDKPMRMNFVILLAAIAYYCLAVTGKTGMARKFDNLNVPIYTLISCVVSTYLCRIKLRRLYLEQKYVELSVRDHLTGVYNRRNYELKLEELRAAESIDSVTFLLMDINGLKQCNDTLGHQAGDEMIKGAASCISAAFSSAHTTYRIGGDEFAVILENCEKSSEELLLALHEETKAYRMREGKPLEIACGIARVADYPGLDIDSLIKKVDESMYADKERFYADSEHNRRAGR